MRSIDKAIKVLDQKYTSKELKNMSVERLREIASEVTGRDKNKLYGTSKETLIFMILRA